jgi:hypothetical protein
MLKFTANADMLSMQGRKDFLYAPFVASRQKTVDIHYWLYEPRSLD